MWRDLKRAGRQMSSVAIVGSTTPLLANGFDASRQTEIIELCSPENIPTTFNRFRDGLIFDDFDDQRSHRSWLERIRAVCTAVGALVVTVTGEQSSALGRCD
jgi:hypothetical protein